MKEMGKEQLEALADRIGEVGKDVLLDDFLAALGVTVINALMQLQSDERMPATIAWIAILTRTMINNHTKSRAN